MDILDRVFYEFTRPRGYNAWAPNPTSAILVSEIQAILIEYAAYLPLTARQIYYRLVGRNTLPKTEQAYQRLLSALTKARRAQMISFDSIRDDGATSSQYGGWGGPEDFIRSLPRWADGYERDLREGQDENVEVWVEAAGMVPQTAGVASEYGVSVFSSGGFDSVTVKHNAALRIMRDSRVTTVLHVGDLDPSGVALFNAAKEDVSLFVAQHRETMPEFERIAVNLDQIERFGLETAPPKPRKDAQRLPGGWEEDWPTVQAEAFAPDILLEQVRRAIEIHTDLDVMQDVRDRSGLESERLRELVSRVEWSERDGEGDGFEN